MATTGDHNLAIDSRSAGKATASCPDRVQEGLKVDPDVAPYSNALICRDSSGRFLPNSVWGSLGRTRRYVAP